MMKTNKILNGKTVWSLATLILSVLLMIPANVKADGSIEISGSIQAKSDSSITVNSLEFIVNSSTSFSGSMGSAVTFDSLKIGSFVKVEAQSNLFGKLIAKSIKLMISRISLQFSGEISAVSANSFTVDDKEIFVDENTIILTQFHAALNFSDLKVGDNVNVKATQTAGGTLTAGFIMVLTEKTKQEIEIEGKIQSIAENSFTVQNQVFFTDSTTIILSKKHGVLTFADLKIGDEVNVRGYMRQDSAYQALYVSVDKEDYDKTELEIEGVITALSESGITVNTIAFAVDSSTVIFSHEGSMLQFSDLKLGDKVEVKSMLTDSGAYLALRIKLETDESKENFETAGKIDAINADTISVGGYNFVINSETKIYNQFKQQLSLNDLSAGTFVVVKAAFSAGIYFANTVKVITQENEKRNVTGPIQSLDGTSITVSGFVFVTDENTEFVDNNRNAISYADLKEGQIVSIKAMLRSDSTYYALHVRANVFWRPTVIVEGTIELLTAESITVMGKTFAVDAGTKIIGHGIGLLTFADLSLGMEAEVKGALNTGGVLTAKLIKIHPQNEFEVHGKIDSLGTNFVVVAGLTLKADQSTLYYDQFDNASSFDSLKVNQVVEVDYIKTELDENLAVKIEIENDPNTVQFSGVVTASASGSLSLSAPSFAITDNTVFIDSDYMPVSSASIQSGESVTVWAQQDQSGNLNAMQVQKISANVTAVNPGEKNKLPNGFALEQNYPNPFNPSTVISFSIAKQEEVSLVVYNIIGQEVAGLINAVLAPGAHTLKFNAVNLTSGVYFYRLKAGNFVSVKKMILMK